MKLYLGIDGGQSSTTAMIGDESGKVVGVGFGGPCNHIHGPEGRPRFESAILTSVSEAVTAVGIADVAFESLCAGLSGGPDDKDELLRSLVEARHYFITTDAMTALTGATAGEPGIITISGTGSISYGRNASGKFARAGGWGYIFGDEGSGFDIVRQALRAVLRHAEGWGPETLLHSYLVEATESKNANDLLHRFYTTDFPRARIAGFAALVDECAAAGDAIARSIILNAAQQLATETSAVRSQLFGPQERADIAYIGGVFRSETLRERFTMLVELEDGNRVIEPVYGPAAGALLEAYRQRGMSPQLQNVPHIET